MDIRGSEFASIVDVLRGMARDGSPVNAMLEFVRESVAHRSSAVHAVMAFRRAFDISLHDATSIGGWAGFSETGLGRSGDELEAEFGELLRGNVRAPPVKEV